jgi:hypothetical protein
VAGHTVTISVLADTKQFSRAFRDLSDQTGLTRLGSTVKTLGRTVAAAGATIGAGVVVGVAKSVQAASELQQSIGAVDAVFKGNAGVVKEWAAGASQSVGLTKSEYLGFASLLGTQLKSAGTPLDEIAGKTDNLIKWGADLSAMYGGTAQQAVEGFTSALKGEYEILDNYGISINAARIETEALALGHKKVNGELSDLAKQEALMSLVEKQAADARGAFARESNTFAGQQARLKATLGDLSAEFGAVFLPIATKVAGYLNENLRPAFERVSEWVRSEGIPRFKEFAAWFGENILPALLAVWSVVTGQLLPALVSFGSFVGGTIVPVLADMVAWLGQNADIVIPLVAAVVAGVAAFRAYNTVLGIVKAAQALATAAQIGFNVALTANPIGIVIALVAALVAGLVYFFTQTDTGREVWGKFTDFLGKAWQNIQLYFKVGYESVKQFLGKAWEFIKTVWSYSPLGLVIANWDKIIAYFKALPAKIKVWLDKAIGFVKTVWSYTPLGLIIGNWDRIIGFFKGIPGKVKPHLDRAIAFIKTVWSYTPLGMLINNWGRVTSFFRSIPGIVKGAFAGAGSWLYNAGRDVLAGLINGLQSALYRVQQIAYDIANSLTSGVKSVLGIFSPSRVFRGFGENVIAGLVIGLDELAGLRSTMREVSGVITDGFAPSLDMPQLAGAPGRGGYLNVTVQVPPTADTLSIGREIKRVLTEYENVAGGGFR